MDAMDKTGSYCRVYLLDTPYSLDRPFDYSCGDDLRAGDIVRVPFGRANHLRTAMVISVSDTPSDTASLSLIKGVGSVVRNGFSLSAEMLAL